MALRRLIFLCQAAGKSGKCADNKRLSGKGAFAVPRGKAKYQGEARVRPLPCFAGLFPGNGRIA